MDAMWSCFVFAMGTCLLCFYAFAVWLKIFPAKSDNP
jgi:hypothetical protein